MILNRNKLLERLKIPGQGCLNTACWVSTRWRKSIGNPVKLFVKQIINGNGRSAFAIFKNVTEAYIRDGYIFVFSWYGVHRIVKINSSK